MSQLLRTAGWLFAIVLSTVPSYWFLVHPRAEHWRRRRGARFRILGPLWVAMWVAVGAITWPWRHLLLYDNALPWAAAAPFFAVGFYLYHRAGTTFSFAQLIGRPELQGVKFEQRLVTTGIHARVRHPVYLGHLCELIGWSLGTGLAIIYGLTAFAIITGAVMIRMEDDELVRRFGEPFRQYRKTTPAVIPSLVSQDADQTITKLRARS